MIITKLQGGIGNQMFQYAIAKHLALLNKTELKIDISYYNNQKSNDTPRNYNLSCFNIVENFASKEDTKKIGLPNMESKNIFAKINRKIKRYVESKKPLHKKIFINEPQFKFEPDILKIKENVYLSGNWQSEKYFLDIKDTIRNEFTLKEKTSGEFNLIKEKIISSNSISLHIRRDDYIENKKTNSFHGTCSLDYYNKATDIIKEKIENPTFFIFSDDINWVRKNFKTNSTTIFVSHEKLKDYEELILMSKCQHNIIANSSFSWWGAWLNDNIDKMIIAPKKWFNNSDIDIKDLIPKNWLKI